MTDFKLTDVDTEVISNAVAGVGACIDIMESIDRTLRDRITALLNPYWQDAAKESFMEKINGFCVAYHSFVHTHRDLNENLRIAGSAYSGADESAVQAIAKIPR